MSRGLGDVYKRQVSVNTGIGFFDHMLTALGVHSGIDMDVECTGDLYVDGHHTVEDVGICLGKAFAEALGDKAGIARYGSAFVPMDEALAFCSLDISGRPFLAFNAEFHDDRIGQYDTCLTEEFFRAFAFNSGITLHIREEYGKNDHRNVQGSGSRFEGRCKNNRNRSFIHQRSALNDSNNRLRCRQYILCKKRSGLSWL